MKDTTDRNRTSPFAFTGNKFEFRMLGSAASVANPNVVLNTAVAEALSQFYTELEGTKPEDMEQAVHELIKRAIRKHKKLSSTATVIPMSGLLKQKNADYIICRLLRTACHSC